MITAKAFADHHYAVLGLARSGLATVEALLASGARVTAWDDREEARAKVPAAVQIEDFVGGNLSRFDSIVVTPGLPLNRHPIAAAAKAAGVEIIGDIELFSRARPELPPHKVVGITGTNGKSTTTALVHHILKTAGVPTTMGGNIGLPILSQNPLPEGGVYVLELSSYQIDLTKSLDCEVAVLLNITPDHLDRYESFHAYAASKVRLFEMQSRERHFSLYPWQLAYEGVLPDPAKYGGWFLKTFTEVDRNAERDWPGLQGPHNRQNAAAAEEVIRTLDFSFDVPVDSLVTFEAGCKTYPGLPHRMERIRERDGVLFVNDSKATNAEAAAPALAAYPKVRWIVGGQAKAETLGDTATYLGHVVAAYTIGEAGPMFARLLRGAGVDVIECETLENAVNRAAKDSQAGETVLLSPASASFDQFEDFEARGDRFRELVEGL
ncbi:UDP-N-acetylmuramoyl-L-alanine--D-glutamate ligase [Sphingomonas sp. LY160]|uniref:Mur ligase family protein n=1 Tax=Sphingomonas sp. LY160 TaxID=3095342 RepID=UPI002ADEADAE|nr:UDP-N-acetylmuramoyl-L-alanine--D-glutamate ligase [Sphingomonas sp. LY160]MEA1071919.1 UDP-N-acetylmuramoyl-L-alanine--D-glutamate ligase [Sphingomonas sp. LY160]